MRTGPFFWLFCLGSALAPNALAANLVVNGSFESPAAPANWFSTAIPTGWSTLGNGSTTDSIHSGYSGAVATTGNDDLKFQSPSGAYEGPFIDDVSLVAVPDPSSSLAGLACSTLGFLVLRRWRR